VANLPRPEPFRFDTKRWATALPMWARPTQKNQAPFNRGLIAKLDLALRFSRLPCRLVKLKVQAAADDVVSVLEAFCECGRQVCGSPTGSRDE
jgi:hypothetical protein